MKKALYVNSALLVCSVLFLSSCSNRALKVAAARSGANPSETDSVANQIDTTCQVPLTATMDLVNPPAQIYTGSQLTFRITASGCTGLYSLESNPGTTFASTVMVTKAFPNAGSVSFTEIVRTIVASSGQVYRTFAVQSPTITILQLPPAPRCFIEKVAETYSGPGQPLHFRMRAEGEVISASFNGLPALLNTSLAVAPNSSGAYVTTGSVAGIGGARDCEPTQPYFPPSCSLAASNISVSSVTLTATLFGVISTLKIDGQDRPLPVPPSQTAVLTKAISFAGASLPAACEVTDPFAVKMTQTISFNKPPAPTVTLLAKGETGGYANSPLTIANNARVLLNWTSTNATSCTIDRGMGTVAVNGNDVQSPALGASGNITATCSGPGGTSAPSSVTVNIRPPKQSCTIIYKTCQNCGCNIYHPEFLMAWVPAIPFQNASAGAMDAALQQYVPSAKYVHYPAHCQNTNSADSFVYDQNTYRILNNGIPAGLDCTVYTFNFSPLLMDLENQGISLTSPVEGPAFNLTDDGIIATYSWPKNPSSSAFLVFDKNGNGEIDGIQEMFGNATKGPQNERADNGFDILKLYDENQDGFIDNKDSVYSKLAVWQDLNINGKSEAGELTLISQKGIVNITTAYENIQEQEGMYGDISQQRSVIKMTDGSVRKIVDIWLVRGK